MSCAQEMSSLLNVFDVSSFGLLADMIKHLVNIIMHVLFLYGFCKVFIAVFMSYCRELDKEIEELIEHNKDLTKKLEKLEYAMADRGYKLHDDGRMYTW